MSDHNACRAKVCIVCLGKASSSSGLSKQNIELVNRFVRQNYTVNDPDYPCGICNGCHTKIYLKAKDSTVVLKVAPFIPDRGPRSRSRSL